MIRHRERCQSGASSVLAATTETVFALVPLRGATEATTRTVFEHRRRHLRSAGDVPSPRVAAASCAPRRPGANFLCDGVAIHDHHAARPIRFLFTWSGPLANNRNRTCLKSTSVIDPAMVPRQRGSDWQRRTPDPRIRSQRLGEVGEAEVTEARAGENPGNVQAPFGRWARRDPGLDPRSSSGRLSMAKPRRVYRPRRVVSLVASVRARRVVSGYGKDHRRLLSRPPHVPRTSGVRPRARRFFRWRAYDGAKLHK